MIHNANNDANKADFSYKALKRCSKFEKSKRVI